MVLTLGVQSTILKTIVLGDPSDSEFSFYLRVVPQTVVVSWTSRASFPGLLHVGLTSTNSLPQCTTSWAVRWCTTAMRCVDRFDDSVARRQQKVTGADVKTEGGGVVGTASLASSIFFPNWVNHLHEE